MNILEALPLLAGWRHENIIFNIDDDADASLPSLSPGSASVLLDTQTKYLDLTRVARGWLLGITAGVSRWRGRLSIEVDNEGFPLRVDALEEAINRGLEPNPSLPYVSRYPKIIRALRSLPGSSGGANPSQLSTSKAEWVPTRDPVTIEALPTNTDNVYLAETSANSSSSTGSRWTLAAINPRPRVVVPFHHLQTLWVYADVAGEGVQSLITEVDDVNITETTSPGAFVLAYTPAAPLAFRERLRIWVDRPAEPPPRSIPNETQGGPMFVIFYKISYIIINDEDAFRASLQLLNASAP